MDVFDLDGIDWFREPLSHRESEGFGEIGGDLKATLDDWHDKFSTEMGDYKRAEYADLLELARRDVGSEERLTSP